MIIKPGRNFIHAGELPPRFDSQDPRTSAFRETDAVIDLGSCEFIGVPAVLWCLVYALLAKVRGSRCTLVVPSNMGVCVYLKSTGLFNVLQTHDVVVDDRGVFERQDNQLVLPLTHFQNENQVEQAANDALDSLQQSGLGASNLHPLVSEIFGELAMNAVQHSESSIGAFGIVQFYQSEGGQRFVCGVADGGIGIRRSLEGNPSLKGRFFYDWDAIELATRERVSGLTDATRGIGLYGVAEDMRRAGRHLILHSGLGSLQIEETLESQTRKSRLFPGTLAYVSIPT